MSIWFWIAMGLIALIIVGVGLWLAQTRRQRERLRERFGPEYDRTVADEDSRLRAERNLREREKRVEEYELRPMSREQRDRVCDEIELAQARFVDDPVGATEVFDELVVDVMRARGYPDGDGTRRAEDLSVHHPRLAEDYRTARDVAAGRYTQSTTEDRRQALIRLREVVETLMDAERSEARPEAPYDREAEGPRSRRITLDDRERASRR